ncbi:formate/nitrite transporter FocA (FNT family) [Hasllibacter halocynthiae]|uniref:Formate/nitrite transporter FocA (FNT family) n=1 Tax=Hasllibacter halocynthiae TaxID=595589 RepID=A0A2T0X1R1_9RHOB|nr:formate/nitrite transporter family protein [Hasllibacter halocynthiae]PRY92893.1 formate/nitrite transporter FocA (FNT family) [Hasllibacter halocynthiae]
MADHSEALTEEGEEHAREVRDEMEDRSIENAAGLSSKMIYEVIRRSGEEELARPISGLVWSGIAAGLLISFSVLGEAIFRTYLPAAEWTYLLENLGYSLGFMLVIMGRMQLFTENTITTVLPFMIKPTWAAALDVLRLWAIVLGANLVGAFMAAALFHSGAIAPELHPAIHDLSVHATHMGALDGFLRGVPAGILIAAIVWMMPQAEDAKFFIIIVFTWLIAAGDFTHIVAGSVEMGYLLLAGELGIGLAVFGFFLPVLMGNVVGGTAVFSVMAWGQVKDEIRMTEARRARDRRMAELREHYSARRNASKSARVEQRQGSVSGTSPGE